MPLEGKSAAFAQLRMTVRERADRTSRAFGNFWIGKVMPECIEECPVDKGVLQASIPACSTSIRTPRGCTVTIGAGGAASAYARRVHEDRTIQHPFHIKRMESGKYLAYNCMGKAKFIEDPILRNAPLCPAAILAMVGGP